MRTHTQSSHSVHARRKPVVPFARYVRTLIATVILVSSASSFAQAKEDLSIQLTARKVVKTAQGKEEFAPADKSNPGDLIQYDAVYRNQSKGALSNIHPTLPIPIGMIYVPENGKAAPKAASLDGRTFHPIPLKKQVKLPDGGASEVEIPVSEYRALRWSIASLHAGQSTNITARVRVATPSLAGSR
jgi:hypothetical protein